MILFILTLALSLNLHGQPSTRKLLLFGQGQADFKQQLALLNKDSAGMAERDLVLVVVVKEREYKKYEVKQNAFTILLIGKDGGEKFRSVDPVDLKSILELIDGMPMRKAEMRNENK